MKKTVTDGKILRIIDANTNRLTEGLRVCEDVARFILSDKEATRRFKSLRHRTFSAVKGLGADRKLLAEFRDTAGDIGNSSLASEKTRACVADIFKANVKRSEESMRVLEEFSKLSSAALADRFKKMRFELYSLEKRIIEKL
jgi:thiamine-phosphate pyrophosphorylase